MFRLALRSARLGAGVTGAAVGIGLASAAVGLGVASRAYNEPRYIKEEEVKHDVKYISEEEAGLKEPQAYNPETGEINWDCPCLGGMAHGPCGSEFKEAFSCFVYSTADPKGVDCIPKFKLMQDCFRLHPEEYREQLELDDEEEIAVSKPSEAAPTENLKQNVSSAVGEIKETVSEVLPEPEFAVEQPLKAGPQAALQDAEKHEQKVVPPLSSSLSKDSHAQATEPKDIVEKNETLTNSLKTTAEDLSSDVAASLRKGEDVAAQVKSDVMKSLSDSKE